MQANLSALESKQKYALLSKCPGKTERFMALTATDCDLDPALFVLNGKWTPLILHHLSLGTRRYGELRRAVEKATDKVLIQQLKDLQADGIVERTDHNEKSPNVDYSLTPFGASLVVAMGSLIEWSNNHPEQSAHIRARHKPR
jgi:DNA-binding HxlR family transcriptional regulator